MGLNSQIDDKEDSFQFYTALNESAVSYFLTGNKKDFVHSNSEILLVLTPKEFLEILDK